MAPAFILSSTDRPSRSPWTGNPESSTSEPGARSARAFAPPVATSMEPGREWRAATATECDAHGGAAVDGGEAKESEAAAAASSSAQALSAGMKRTLLRLPDNVVTEVVDAAARGKLERLQTRCRMWEEAHPDAPACFGTAAWVPALWTVAHVAASAGRTRVLQWLVEERGVPVHRLTLEEKGLLLNDFASSEPYETPMFSAVDGGHEETALYLLRAGLQRGTIDANYNGNKFGATVLHVGAMKGIGFKLMTAVVDLGGFDPTTPHRTPAGRSTAETPQAIAAKRGHVQLVDYFLRWARRQSLIFEARYHCLDKEKNGVTLTRAAIRNRQLEVVKPIGWDSRMWRGYWTRRRARVPERRRCVDGLVGSVHGMMGCSFVCDISWLAWLSRFVCNIAHPPAHVQARTARTAEAELLRLLEEEEAAATGQTQQAAGGGGSKKQKKKGTGKAKKGDGGMQAGAAVAAEQEQECDAVAAALAAVSVDDKDGGDGGEAQRLSEEDSFVLARAWDKAPDFICPLLGRIMQRVALASDGYSYEWLAIEAHVVRCQAGAWFDPNACARMYDAGQLQLVDGVRCMCDGLMSGGVHAVYAQLTPPPHPHIHTHAHPSSFSRPRARLPQDRRADRPGADAEPDPAQSYRCLRRRAAAGVRGAALIAATASLAGRGGNGLMVDSK